MMKRTSFFGVSSRRSCRSSQNCSTSTSLALVVGALTWIAVILNGLPWKRTEFGLGVQNEAHQSLTEFCQENTLVIANTLFQQHKRDSTHGYHQMVNNKISLIIFFAAKYGEALYSQQKQDQELTVAQIMSSLPQNSDLN